MKRHRIIVGLLVLLALPLGAEDPCQEFLETYNWSVEKELVETKIQLSEKEGMPDLFYRRASSQIGLDMKVTGTQTLRVRKFLLKERGQVDKSEVYAHLAVSQGRVFGAWLSTNAPIAPGIFSLDDKSFLKEL